MLDYYLDLADKTQNEPDEFQSRWNCDGSFWVWVYEKKKSQAEFERLIERIRDGHISLPLNALCVCPGRRACGGGTSRACIIPVNWKGVITCVFQLPTRWKTRPCLLGWAHCGPAPEQRSVGRGFAIVQPRFPMRGTANMIFTGG